MMKQYLDIKKDFQDSILFFRLGDFYEMFFDDAKKAAGVLNITLTSRDKRADNPVPLCGVPYHSADGYISKLLDHGHKVAICEQVEDAKEAKGIVRREVVRVITPGLRTDQEGLAAKDQNTLVSISQSEEGYALSWLDAATLRFEICFTANTQELIHEIRRLSPKELIVAEALNDVELLAWIDVYVAQKNNVRLEKMPSAVYRQAEKKVCERFSVHTLEGFGFERPSLMAESAVAILHYVEDINRNKLSQLAPPKTYHWGNYLYLDPSTKEHLELFRASSQDSQKHSLFECLDETATSMGSRKFKDWMHFPLRNIQAIDARLDAVEELNGRPELQERLRADLAQVFDMERLLARISGERANARDLVAMKECLQRANNLKLSLSFFTCKNLVAVHEKMHVNGELLKRLESMLLDNPPFSVREGGIIRDGVHAELDEYKNIGKVSKAWLADLEAREKQRTGITTLKIGYNRVFGYFLEATKSHLAKVPPEYERRQTLANAERYVTPDLKEYESKILGAEEKIQQLEYQLFEDLRKEVTSCHSELKTLADLIAETDAYVSLAKVAARYQYVRPQLTEGATIDIVDGRHPVVETFLQRESFICNSLRLDDQDQQLIILTGPNMAGKSTIMRQMALIVYMAQLGCFVPAQKAEIGVVDRIFTRVGASDDLAGGRSTFMVEMNETANILRHATKDSLVILDEIGRGTSTFDGLAIAWAVAEDLHDRIGCKTIFATHYHELTELASQKNKVKNMNVSVKEWNGEIIFVRKLASGAVNRSYGIEVARLAGVLPAVIDRAKHVLSGLEKGSHGVSAQVASPQLDLFAAKKNAIEEELKTLDLHQVSPMQALLLLDTWQKHYRNS